MSDQIADAVVAIKTYAEAHVTAPGSVDHEALPPVKFNRLSVERRLLGHITDESDHDAIGPRNTLPALIYALTRDPNTTRPRGGIADALDVSVPIEQVAEKILSMLNALIGAGLVEVREDGSYAVTEAGHVELNS